MKAAAITMLAACAVLAAACATSAPPPPAAQKPTTTAASQPATVSQPAAVTPSPAVADASASERALANWLAAYSPDPSSVASVIGGPVMRDYAQFEALYNQALAAAGHPLSPDTVSAIPGGYQLCGTVNGSTSCDSFTGWQTDAQGRVTDLAVDGQLISPRLAAGRPSTGSQLAISDVLAYRPGGSNEVAVVYKVRNVSGHVVGNGNPAWLAVFDPSGGGEFQEDQTNSIIPGNLQPGESAVELVAFSTRTVTGAFSLRTNDQLETVLAASVLRMP